MKIAIVDVLGLSYDGNTVYKKGLGGSESAVVYMSQELVKLGHEVTVFNDCVSNDSTPGTYSDVIYRPYTDIQQSEFFDILIASRSISIFTNHQADFKHSLPEPATGFVHLVDNPKVFKVLWMHDTFCDGDNEIEPLVRSGKINRIFTLSDWHTAYITNCDHGIRRNFDVLKKHIFQTRNGIGAEATWIDITKKDPNLFVFNASVTKGMIPLVKNIWPKVKERLPDAKLTVIGGFYNMGTPDKQQQDWQDLVLTYGNHINFTGVITQQEISSILEKASYMIYPSAFPETFGISTLEALAHNVPVIACNFGAMEETAIDSMCYKIDYPVEKNWAMQWLDEEVQCEAFANLAISAADPSNRYLHQQKMYACNRVKEIAGWDTIALQWDQYLTRETNRYYPVDRQRKAQYINRRVAEVFGRVYGSYHQTCYPKLPEKKILVITPCKNAESYISKAMISVACQDYDNYEMFVIVDAADDNTYDVAVETAMKLNDKFGAHRFSVIENETSVGALANQITILDEYKADINMLLDGDDTLVNNPYIFDMYNYKYHQGIQLTYGSCYSMVDNIPLIAQEYPMEVHLDKSYREYDFAWGIPYTHLRTFSSEVVDNIKTDTLLDTDGNFYRAGGDSALLYAMLEATPYTKIEAIYDVVVNYNDTYADNDYKINSEEQTRNAKEIKAKKMQTNKKVLIAIPTNVGIEPETFKSIYELDVPEGYETQFQTFHGYRVDQIRNLIADWTIRGFDYLLAVDHDIVLPKDALARMLSYNVDIVSGIYRQRMEPQKLEIYDKNMNRTDLDGERGLIDIGGCGFGCVLVKSAVFEKVGYPQFEYHHALDHNNTFSEDVDFCKKATQAGFKIFVDTGILCGHIGKTTFTVNLPEKETHLDYLFKQDLLPKDHREFLYALAKDGKSFDTIYDIGSCVQHWGRHAKKAWPSSEVISFEAMEEVKKYYASDMPLVYGYLLGDKDGEDVPFYRNVDHPGGNSIFKENPDLSPRAEELFPEDSKIYLPMAKLDTLVDKFKLPIPQLIKMDVQGSELAVLKGAKETLRNVDALILELQHENYNMGAPLKEEVISYLDSLGFELQEKITDSDLGVDADYYFVRS